LLGEVTTQVDGQLVDVGPARQRCVLAALAVDAGRLVPAERLVGRVWGADTPRRGRATLHSYISRLRMAFAGALTIVHRSDGYTLEVDQAERAVDLLRFRALCACCPALRMSMMAAFAVGMFVDELTPPAGAGRGRGVQGVGVVITLS
jgi:DNA-binding SARP family transcriptional activator